MSDAIRTSTPIFVRESMTADRAPPVSNAGPAAWIRDNLFPTPLSSVITLLALLFLAWALPPLVRWLFIDAIWSAPNGDLCRAPGAGACWAYVWQKLGFFMYPMAENATGRLDSYAPDDFKYQITAREVA